MHVKFFFSLIDSWQYDLIYTKGNYMYSISTVKMYNYDLVCTM